MTPSTWRWPGCLARSRAGPEGDRAMGRMNRLSVVFVLVCTAVCLPAVSRLARADGGPADLIAQLRGDDPAGRAAAAEALGRIGPDAADAVDDLIDAMDADDFYVRANAAWAIGRIGARPGESMTALSDVLYDVDPLVRRCVTGALACYGERAIDLLTAELKPRDRDPRASIGARPVADDADLDDVTMLLARALGTMGGPAYPAIIAAMDRQNDEACAPVLAANGKAIVPLLRGSLQAGEPHVAMNGVILALGMIGPDAAEAAPDLMAELEDPHGSPSTAAWALGVIGAVTPEAVPALIQATQEDAPCDRGVAIEALGEIGPAAEAAIPRLLEIMGLPAETVRKPAVVALGRIGVADDEVIAALLTEVLDPGSNSSPAIEALWRLGPPAAEALALVIARTGWHAPVAEAAAALAAMGPDAAGALGVLTVVLEHSDRQHCIGQLKTDGLCPADVTIGDRDTTTSRLGALTVIVAMGPAAKDAAESVLECFTSPPASQDNAAKLASAAVDALLAIGPDALDAWVELLRNADPGIVRTVLMQLKARGPEAKTLAEALTWFLRRREGRPFATDIIAALSTIAPEDPEVIEAVALALGNVASAGAAGYDLSPLDAYARLGPPLVPRLLALARDHRPYGAHVALTVLTAMGPAAAEATPFLTRALSIADGESDPSAQVCVDALAAIGPEAEAALPALLAMFEKHDLYVDPTPAILAIRPDDPRMTSRVIQLLVAADRNHPDEPAPLPVGYAYAIGMLSQGAPPQQSQLSSLIKLVASKRPEIRQGAAAVIGRMGPAGARAVRALIEMAQPGDDPDRRTDEQRVALGALASIGPDAGAAGELFLEILSEDGRFVGDATALLAAEGLAAIGVPGDQGVPALLGMMQEDARAWTGARGLAAYGPQAADAVDELVAMVVANGRNADAALIPLRTIGRAVVGPIAAEIRREDMAKHLRTKLLNVLDALGPGAKGAVPALIELLRRDQREAIWALGTIGPAAAQAETALEEALAGGFCEDDCRRALANIRREYPYEERLLEAWVDTVKDLERAIEHGEGPEALAGLERQRQEAW